MRVLVEREVMIGITLCADETPTLHVHAQIGICRPHTGCA